MRGHGSGVTILETVVLLAILAMVASVVSLRGFGGYEFARAFALFTTSARHRAVVSGVPVALRTVPCDSMAHIDANPLAARVIAFPTRGLLFTPDGLPRTCDGGGVGNTTILLEYRGRQAAVIVSSLGRVRWEPR